MNEALVDFGTVGRVMARFDYEPECLGYGAHPDHDATLTITELLLCGIWVDAAQFSDEDLEPLERAILAERGKSLAEEAAMAAWERYQERLMEDGYP